MLVLVKALDGNRGDREPQTELDRASLHRVRPAFLEERVAENAAVPVLVLECSVLQFFLDGLTIAPATLEYREPIGVKLKFLAEGFPNRTLFFLHEVAQLALERDGGNLAATVGSLTRVAFTIRVAVGVRVNDLDNEQSRGPIGFVVGFLAAHDSVSSGFSASLSGVISVMPSPLGRAR